MLRVYDCITRQHDLGFVVVAGLICLFACFTLVSLLNRTLHASGTRRAVWLGVSAVVGGSGIWATHFVAMLALRQNFLVVYDLDLTLLSIGIAIGVTWCGFFIALEGGAYVVLGGIAAGLAVSAMHYVGMAAIHAPATMEWNIAYIVASVLIGTSLVTGALMLAARSTTTPGRRFAAATLYALGILGMHFTAMAAVTFLPEYRLTEPIETLNEEWMSIAVAVVTVLIIAFGFIGSLVDQHVAERLGREAALLQEHVDELEATKRELEQTTTSLMLALDQAAASNQAKSQFLAAMSHELRTPLNAVIGFSELMAREIYGPIGDAHYRDYARSICDSGAHLLGLINDVLDVSRLDTGGLELNESDVDPGDIIDEAVRMVERQASTARLSLSVDLGGALPMVRVDSRRIRQVLLNVLSNALKFTRPGGKVTVTAYRCAEGMAIAIADNGIGIAEADIPLALESFGQVENGLERRFEGVGLGLPLSKSLMELHGGTLALESTVGKGTTVTLTLPASRLLGRLQVA